MATRLTNRWGDTTVQPTSGNLVAALTELEVEDPEHLACWLSDEDDWTISVFANGLVFLDHAQSEEGPWHMLGVSQMQAFELRSLLIQRNLAELRKRPWRPGYPQ